MLITALLVIIVISAWLLYRHYFVGGLPASPHASILGTNTKSNNIYHQLLVNPTMLDQFKHDSILICFEKVHRSKLIVTNGNKQVYNVSDQYATFGFDLNLSSMLNNKLEHAISLVKNTLNDPKPIILTHWIETTPEQHNIRYNAYEIIKDQDYDLPKTGANQLQTIADLVKDKIQSGKYTHLLITCSGWNNYQGDSRDLYENWLNFTKKAAEAEGRGDDFRPFLIGVTWPSRWITPALSFFNKANDADELGMTHISTLIFKYILPALKSHRVPVITIGHSFGGRVMSRADHSRFMQNGYDASTWIDKAIEFQGAYPLTRFCEKEGSNGGLYTVDVPVKKHFMTCSIFDSAIQNPFWSRGYIGDPKSIELLRNNPVAGNNFEFTSVNDTGRFNSLQNTHPKILVDAKAFINKMGSKLAGAHNDVRDKEAGQMIWEIIKL